MQSCPCFLIGFYGMIMNLTDMQQLGRRGRMSKPKKKSGTGQGTGKKGWNRWQAGANKAKSNKPYKSKGVKHGNKADADK
jgi:hypothetical protein